MQAKRMRVTFGIFLIVLAFGPCAARKQENDQKLSRLSEIENRDVHSILTNGDKVPNDLSKPKDSIHSMYPVQSTNPVHSMNPGRSKNPVHYINPVHSTNPVHSMNPVGIHPVQYSDTTYIAKTAQVPVQVIQNLIKGSKIDLDLSKQQSEKLSTSKLETERLMMPSRRQRKFLPVTILARLLPRVIKVIENIFKKVPKVPKEINNIKDKIDKVETVINGANDVIDIIDEIKNGNKNEYEKEDDTKDQLTQMDEPRGLLIFM